MSLSLLLTSGSRFFIGFSHLAADVSTIKQDVKEIKATVTKLEEKAQR